MKSGKGGTEPAGQKGDKKGKRAKARRQTSLFREQQARRYARVTSKRRWKPVRRGRSRTTLDIRAEVREYLTMQAQAAALERKENRTDAESARLAKLKARLSQPVRGAPEKVIKAFAFFSAVLPRTPRKLTKAGKKAQREAKPDEQMKYMLIGTFTLREGCKLRLMDWGNDAPEQAGPDDLADFFGSYFAGPEEPYGNDFVQTAGKRSIVAVWFRHPRLLEARGVRILTRG